MLDDKDILQINATLIVGLFFFIGLSNFLPLTSEDMNRVFAVSVGVFLVTPFAVSALFAVSGHIRIAKWIMGLGFFTILAGLVAMFILLDMSTGS